MSERSCSNCLHWVRGILSGKCQYDNALMRRLGADYAFAVTTNPDDCCPDWAEKVEVKNLTSTEGAA